MSVLVTGVAGFVGLHVAEALLARGETVVGIDDLNEAYDPALKEARLRRLVGRERFAFLAGDVADPVCLADWAERRGDETTGIVHLAALAPRRWPRHGPVESGHRRLAGHLALLDLCHRLPGLRHLVYALPCPPLGKGGLRPDAEAILSAAFARLHGIPQTGLRLHGVYGPWSRPDTLCHVLADAIAAGRPVTLDGSGPPVRLAFVGDVAAAIAAALSDPPRPQGGAPHRVIEPPTEPVGMGRLVDLIEGALGQPATRRWRMAVADEPAPSREPEPPDGAQGPSPATSLEEGIARFAAWHREHYGRG